MGTLNGYQIVRLLRKHGYAENQIIVKDFNQRIDVRCYLNSDDIDSFVNVNGKWWIIFDSSVDSELCTAENMLLWLGY